MKEVIKSQSNGHDPVIENSHNRTSLSPDTWLPPLKAHWAREVSFSNDPISSFFGTDNSEASAYEVGERALGGVELTGMAIVELYQQ